MVKVFFSYATKDKYIFQISQLANLLKLKHDIDNVFYWEESASGSIIERVTSRLARLPLASA